VTIYDEGGQGHTPGEKLLLHPGTKLEIESSGLGLSDLQWHCSLDAIDLTSLMGDRRWQGQREKDHDWLAIERHARAYFETFGAPKFDQKVFDYVLDRAALIDAHPTTSTLRQLIARLRIEYTNL
jgi:hypothetical protein